MRIAGWLTVSGLAVLALLAWTGATAAGGEAPIATGTPVLEVYGFVKLDAIYDFKRMNPAWNHVLRASQIPIVPEGRPPH